MTHESDQQPTSLDWAAIEIGSVARVETGFPFKSETFSDTPIDGGCPLVRIRDVPVRSSTTYIRPPVPPEVHTRYLVRNGDVLIGMDGQFHLAKWAGGDALLNQRVARVEFDLALVDPDFAFYAMARPLRLVEEAKHYTTVKHLSMGDLRSLRISAPSLAEQAAIAEVLRTVQQARDATEQVIAAARVLKRSMFQHFLSDAGLADWASAIVEQDSEAGPSSGDWKLVKLSDVATVRYGLGQPPDLDDQGVPMIRATNIKRGRIVATDMLRVKRAAIPASREAWLCAGDVIVVRSGAYTGDVALITPDWEGAVAGYDLVVTPREGLHPRYCAEYLLGPTAQRYFKSRRDRSAQPHLNREQLSGIVIALPPLAVQEQIAGALESVDAKVEAEQQRHGALDSLFAALLHELMSARVRVPADPGAVAM
jgi:type I restriction enzyme S subunit